MKNEVLLRYVSKLNLADDRKSKLSSSNSTFEVLIILCVNLIVLCVNFRRE